MNCCYSQDKKNVCTGEPNDIFIINELISHIGLPELPLKGRSYTWSNMKQDPLFVQLECFFRNSKLDFSVHQHLVLSLSKSTSDHVPCLVSIDNVIPQVQLFRFKNFYLVDQPSVLECVYNLKP
jgi:hypothetical protein